MYEYFANNKQDIMLLASYNFADSIYITLTAKIMLGIIWIIT